MTIEGSVVLFEVLILLLLAAVAGNFDAAFHGGFGTDIIHGKINRVSVKLPVACKDKQSQELCICVENYSDNIQSKDWQLLEDAVTAMHTAYPYPLGGNTELAVAESEDV